MNKKFITIASTVVVALLLAFTCPNKQAHKEALNDVLKSYVDGKLYDNSENNPFAIFGTLFTSKFIDMFLDSKLKVDNYVVFSIGKVNNNEMSKTVSFGILNHVFTLNEKDIDNAIKKAEDKSNEPNE